MAAHTTTWLTNPDTPTRIISEVLTEHTTRDWDLPHYLLEHLENLATVDEPTQAQVDEARIPLTNWFRQQREAATDGQ